MAGKDENDVFKTAEMELVAVELIMRLNADFTLLAEEIKGR